MSPRLGQWKQRLGPGFARVGNPCSKGFYPVPFHRSQFYSWTFSVQTRKPQELGDLASLTAPWNYEPALHISRCRLGHSERRPGLGWAPRHGCQQAERMSVLCVAPSLFSPRIPTPDTRGEHLRPPLGLPLPHGSPVGSNNSIPNSSQQIRTFHHPQSTLVNKGACGDRKKQKEMEFIPKGRQTVE